MKQFFKLLSVSLTIIFLIGCSSSDSNFLSSQFEPEIVNTADAFQFQATGVENVTTTLNYDWNNSNTQATINHSSTVSDGTVTVTIFDADSNQVYQSGLLASANEVSTSGTSGTWRIRVVLDHAYGTFNFSVQP